MKDRPEGRREGEPEIRKEVKKILRRQCWKFNLGLIKITHIDVNIQNTHPTFILICCRYGMWIMCAFNYFMQHIFKGIVSWNLFHIPNAFSFTCLVGTYYTCYLCHSRDMISKEGPVFWWNLWLIGWWCVFCLSLQEMTTSLLDGIL